MKTILLLGGFGFIGSNLMHYIDSNLLSDYEVVVFDRDVHHPFGFKFKCNRKVYSGDFSDITCLEPLFEENSFDHIIHLINTTVPATSGNIKFDIESNLISTIEFINLMVKAKVQNIVYLSSGGAIYGNSLEKKTENAENYPQSSYGIVKLTVEKYLMLYSRLGLLKPLILRLSNPFGPYHYSMKQGLLNVALRSAFEQKQFTVWGDGENLKDYIFIEDFADILFTLLKMDIYNEIINVGSGKLITVNKILSYIKDIYPEFTWKHSEAKKFDASNFALDLTKLNGIIGHYSFSSPEKGIINTDKWLKTSNT